MTRIPAALRELQRGQATLDLVYNSAHLMMTPAWHDGRFVTLAETEWLDKLSSERLRRRR